MNSSFPTSQDVVTPDIFTSAIVFFIKESLADAVMKLAEALFK